jgi:hypothetical protein
MRTGSVGNRDAETLIGTLVEPKRSVLGKLRGMLLSSGYSEETGYDAINVESYVSYSISKRPRFILKHKWELAVFVVLENRSEQMKLLEKFPIIKGRHFEENPDDGGLWIKLDPIGEEALVSDLVDFYSKAK